MTQPAYRWMKQNGYGRIIFTSSQSGVFGNPYRANYGAAKTGIIGLMRVLMQEAAPEIRINAIMPNAFGLRMGALGEERVDKDFIAKIMARGNAYADRMSPEYRAALVAWLASEGCTITGQTFSVLRGHFALVFSGHTSGWSNLKGQGPTPELVGDKILSMSDPAIWHEPESGIDEGDIATATLNAVNDGTSQS